MELLIDKCNEMLEALSHPDEHANIKSIQQHPLVAEKHNMLVRTHGQMVQWRQKLLGLWQSTENQILSKVRLTKYRQKMDKVYICIWYLVPRYLILTFKLQSSALNVDFSHRLHVHALIFHHNQSNLL